MEEELVTFKRARMSFRSFIVFMATAGFIIALVSTLFQTLFSLWSLIAGDLSISISLLAKPFLSLLVDPIDAVISGIVVYPIYTKILRRYKHIGMKLYKID